MKDQGDHRLRRKQTFNEVPEKNLLRNKSQESEVQNPRERELLSANGAECHGE